MKLFDLFLKSFRKKPGSIFNLDWAVKNSLITKVEMLLIKRERAIKDYENEVKPPSKRLK